MAWLSLLLFLPWFLLLGSLYWLFPRQPRTARRRLFDSTTLVLAFALSIVSMLWGYRIGVVQPGAGPIWPQVLAVLYAYGAFGGGVVGPVWRRPVCALRPDCPVVPAAGRHYPTKAASNPGRLRAYHGGLFPILPGACR